MADTITVSKKDKEVIDKVRKAFESSRYDQHRQFKEYVWNKCYKTWRSIIENPIPRKSNMFIPITFQTIETMVSKTLGAMFDENKLFDFLPINPKDYPNAEAMTEYANFDIARIPNLYHKLNSFTRNLYTYGTAIIRTYWDFKAYPDPKLKGDIRIERDQFNFKIIPVRDFYIDPFAKTLDDAKWVIQRTVMTLEDFEQMMNTGDFKKLNKQQLESIKTTPSQASTYDNSEIQNEHDFYSSLSFDDERKFIELLEYFDKEENRWITIASDKLVVRDVPNPLNNQDAFPFVTCVDVPDPEHFYGISTAETIYDLQHELNAFRNLRMDKKNFSMNPMYKVRYGSMFNRKDLTPRIGGTVQVKDMDDIQKLDLGDVNNSDYVEEQNIKQDIQTTSSISDFSLGQGSSGMNETATGISIVSSNADSRIVSKVKYIENEALIPLGYAWLGYQAQFMKDKEVIKVAGLPVKIDRRIVGRPYNIKARASTQMVNKQVRQNSLMQLAQISLTHPNVDGKQYMKMMFEEFGVNPEKIVKDAPPPMPDPPQGGTQPPQGANPNANSTNELGTPQGHDFIKGSPT